MASILQIGNKWRAQIRGELAALAGKKSIAKSFESKKEAESWARRTEAELESQKGPMRSDMSLGELIEEYRRMRIELGRPVDPTSNTHYMLNHLDEDLGRDTVQELTPKRLVEWARTRQRDGAGGYTINMELSQLGTVLRHCASFLGMQMPDVVGAARPLLNYGQLITGGGRRSRRPTQDELESLLKWLRENVKGAPHSKVKDMAAVVADAVQVAAITGLRRGELTRITWDGLDYTTKAVLVTQRKHPRRVEARDEWVPLLGDSWDIVLRQPRVEGDGRIFPIPPEKLSDSVTAGVRALGIPDLRLHDMRREATSALRDMGFDADARKAVTGHRSDEIHSRYIKVDLGELHRRYDAALGKQPRPQRQRSKSSRPTSSK